MKLNPQTIDLKNFNLNTIGKFDGDAVMTDVKLAEKSKIKAERDDNNIKLLDLCFQYWSALFDFRDRRRRARRYYRGDQLSDYIINPDDETEYITEEQHIMNQGKLPLKQNVIRQIVKNLIGQYINNPSSAVVTPHDRNKAKDAEILTNAIRSVHQLNQTAKLDTRNVEEFLLSGTAFQKISYQYMNTRNMEDVFIENCNPNYMFYNSDLVDPRLLDLRTIGQLHDLHIDEVIGVFAKNEADAERLKQIFIYSTLPPVPHGKGLSAEMVDSIDFYYPVDPNQCRVIEIWQKKAAWRTYAHDWMDGTYNIVPYSLKQIDAINLQRKALGLSQGMPEEDIPLIEAKRKYEEFWYAKYLSPWGHVLWEGETIYMHEEHPYALILYPLLDGEVWGFVEDIIDQQRYINRLITLMDFIIGFSAKGVLMVPEDSIPDGMDINDFAESWTSFRGVLKIKAKPNSVIPEQITGKATNIGINEMLMLQFKLLQEISGVNPAIQGQKANSGTPSSLYAQEAQNATLNSRDYFETFADFKRMRDNKVLKVIQQFYDDKRHIHISGNTFDNQEMMYDPLRVRDLEAEVVITESKDTPVYRQVIDDILFKLLEMQAINVEMFLENSSLPFADKLLEQIKALRQNAMQQGGIAPGGPVSPDMAQAAQNGQQAVQPNIDPKMMKMIQQIMSQEGGGN